MSSIAPGGMETPVRRYSSAFHPKWVNCRPSLPESLTLSRMRIPAAITSGPMPSPGTTAILLVRLVMGGRIIDGRCREIDSEKRAATRFSRCAPGRHQLDAPLGDGLSQRRIAQRRLLTLPRVVPVVGLLQ